MSTERAEASFQHGDADTFARAEQAGIAHAVDHHGVGALTFRLDDAGDRARLRQHDLVVALDRGGAGFDVDKINLHAVGLKLRCVLRRAETLGGNRRDNADVNGHGKPPLL